MARRLGVLSVLSVLTWTALAAAAGGDLDPTFGTGGIVTDPVLSGAQDIVVLGDGRLLVASETNEDPSALAVARYTDTGALDATFGTGGHALTPIGAAGDTATRLVVQPDGKIVVAGYTYPTTFDDPVIAVVRYDADGALDPTFGTGGVALHNAGTESRAEGLALQADGKIVIAGALQGTSAGAVVGRLNADGTLDTTFGTSGWVIETSLGYPSEFYGVLVQPDGKIVAAGADTFFPPSRYLLVRYDATGARDPSFGTGGAVLTALPQSGYAFDVDLGPGGTLVATGAGSTIGVGHSLIGVLRYLPDGTLDPSFGGGDGIATLAVPNQTTAYRGAVGGDGRIAVAAYRFAGYPGSANDLVAGRFLANGVADVAFGGAGWVAVDVGLNDFGDSVAIQPDGKVVAGGSTASASGLLLARFLDGRCPATPVTDGCKAPIQPFRSTVTIKSDADPAKNRLTWKWKKGAATTLAELGDPTATDSYTLCGYQTSPSGAFLFEMTAPPGSAWRTLGTVGFSYGDRSGAADGVASVKVRSGAVGTASGQLKAKGAGFTPPALPLTTPVTVQLRGSTGLCLTASYGTRITRNDAGRFQAKGH